MKLKTYEIQSKSEFDKEVAKQQLEFRVGNWLEKYIEYHKETYGEDLDNAIEAAGEILNGKSAYKQDNDKILELIDIDPLDDFEGFKYQAELIKVMDLQQIYRSL